VSFDPLSLIVATIALVVSYRAFRHDHTTILRILRAEAIGHSGLFDGRLRSFSELRLVIRNIGISLHNVTVFILFRAPGGYGHVSIPIRRYSPTNELADERGEFAHGMIGDFRFQTDRMDAHELRLLASLTDTIGQEVSIQLYSEGYLVKTFKIGVGWDNLTRRWNEMANRLNPLFNTSITPRGSKRRLFKEGRVFPRLPSIWWALQNFQRDVQSLAKSRAPSNQLRANVCDPSTTPR
jgi:hypothetical protein